MEHFYQQIEGWFDFQNLYSEMVERYPSGSHFVEIGAWFGCSTSYMAVEIANSDKLIWFDTIDT
jgi:predicted O-methyltransferase YrrM